MLKSISIIISLSVFLSLTIYAQSENVFYATNTTKDNRTKEYRNLVNSINKNLSIELTDSTEENWQGAFTAMELINYKTPWTETRIGAAFESIERRSINFQLAALELIYTFQIKEYETIANKLMQQTDNSKVFAMCAEYLLLFKSNPSFNLEIAKMAGDKFGNLKDRTDYAIINSLKNHLTDKIPGSYKFKNPEPLFAADYLKGNVLVFSIQRKNRNYPGIVIVKDKNGNFVKDESGNIFSVPQLARSITNLPGYLTNGNTPQGLFRMDGFAVSQTVFIGPTENIQLTMPYELSVGHFIKDSTVADSINAYQAYANLLPEVLKYYEPLYESFRAGMAGRTEIIAHGTTVNPAYYLNQPYYPLTPTLGCLSTKETWSSVDGKRTESDQQKLVNVIKAAGGAAGYCIVIEIDDQQKPISINDILRFLK